MEYVLKKIWLKENPAVVEIPDWGRCYKVKREEVDNGYRDFLYFSQLRPEGEPGWSDIKTHSKMEVERKFDGLCVFRWCVRYIED